MRKPAIIAMCAVCVALLLAGCGGSQQSEKSLAWPDPPDTARIKYVGTYRSEDQFKSAVGKSLEGLGGKNSWLSFSRPFDVTGDNHGKIYVTDAAQGVFVINENTSEFTKLECKKCTFKMNNPRGIAADTARIYVGLPDLGQVVVLSPAGELLDTIGRRGSLPNPLDIVLDTVRHRVFVVDNRLHQVKVFTEHGDSLFSIGTRGVGDGEFNFPQSVAIDRFGTIYVVDAFNFRVEIFDSAGTFVRSFGKQGDLWGDFAMPKGIAVTADTNIYLLDGQHHHFQIFNNRGELLLFVGKYSARNDGFINPVSMFIDNRNRIYVTDQLNARVQIFQILQAQ